MEEWRPGWERAHETGPDAASGLHEVKTTEQNPDIQPLSAHDLSGAVVPLLKGVVYQEGDPEAWSAILSIQARVRDYVAVLGLELVLDEAEGYAFLRGGSFLFR